jgi:carbamoyltransferase
LWIQPAAGDAGGALGAATFVWHQLLDNPRVAKPSDAQHGSLLGPAYSDDAIRAFLDAEGVAYTACGTDEQLCEETAALLADEKVIGWFQGRMEFGPRALGARSILGDARSGSMQSVMNLKIKFRESFRPFAPICLREHVHEWFEMRENEDSPYMLLVAPVREEVRTPLPEGYDRAEGIDKLNCSRSKVPAITHVDYSARVQTVDSERNPLLHRLLAIFYRRTGCPVAINTSFNVRGEPIVCTPQDAYRCFRATEMDVLVLGRNIILRDQHKASAVERERHLARFSLD